MNPVPYILPLAECRDPAAVGGKALNLARLINAGFPVPGGFAVTTSACRAAEDAAEPPAEVRDAILTAYRGMGSPVVAVRSSATAEDLAEASMAGQYETFLEVAGEQEVVAAVIKCWASLHSERARAYLTECGIDRAKVVMAVVVQKLVAADVAGVLFTANPRPGALGEMLIESSWGLGEAVVAGLVQPDTFVLDRATGAATSVRTADKTVWIPAGTRSKGGQPTPDGLRQKLSLNSRQVLALWRLGLQVMEHFGSAQDIEWAIEGDHVYLLQSRAITTLEEAEAYEESLGRTRADLREAKRAGRGDWARHNIGETLPHPTPLTWDVVRRFMSGDGGFGGMYREAGFEPSPAVCQDGFLDLVAGRIYMDLSRVPEMFFEGYPYAYDPEQLARDPNASQGPPTLPRGSIRARHRVGKRVADVRRKLMRSAADYDRLLDGQILPELKRWVAEEKQRDLRSLDAAELRKLWESRRERALQEFGAKLMLPSLIAAMAMEELRSFCAESFWDAEPGQLANELSAGHAPDQTLLGTQGLWDIAHGKTTVDQWLAGFGHRAPEEFDLATPRWRERPEAVVALAGHLKDTESPVERHHQRMAERATRTRKLSSTLDDTAAREFDEKLSLTHRYLRFREDGKFHLMLAHDLLRDLALEAGRRLDIGTEVFLLREEELFDSLATGIAPLHLLEKRRLARAAEAAIDLPNLITEDKLATLGEQVKIESTGRIPAFSISGGTASGPARIILAPEDAGDPGNGYILVCPSTDPNWTPLFAKAAGLVIERGGMLSHGALVAREMGIPAVVCDGATCLLEDGETVTVDGHHGSLLRHAEQLAGASAGGDAVGPDPADARVPAAMIPPPPGRIERSNGKWRNRLLAVWTGFFLALLLLPGTWLLDRSMAVLDFLLLPLVNLLGRAGTVAAVAAALAAFSIVGQRLLTDNRRLAAGKQRAAALRQQASKLPAGSPRRRALDQAAAPVQLRLLNAALFPLILILGPMVMVFLWFPARIDPASWNAAPGAPVFVTARVNGDHAGDVRLGHAPELRLDERTPPSQKITRIRPVLERLLAQWSAESAVPADAPWELQAAARRTREEMLADLNGFLSRPLPPRDVSWTLQAPEDKDGKFPLCIATDGWPPVDSAVVFGTRVAPEPKEDLGDGKGPVQITRPQAPGHPVEWVKVAYRQQLVQGSNIFWQPVEWLVKPWLPGWLMVYLLVYLPAMFVLKWSLRVP
ncbi:MAG: PEP-utilizing enzyme [Verrucomicrobia bacterium]|nr:PEP-utilizing enzyme [Verrucomicrobiota bacterium]